MSHDTTRRPWGISEQTCRWCGVRQPVGEFYRSPETGWITRECRTCATERLRCWAEVDAEPVVVGRRYVDEGDGPLLCTRCGRSLPRAAFYTWADRHRPGRRYFRPKCRQCMGAEQAPYRKGYRQTEKYQRTNRDRWLRKKYGIGADEYDALLKKQEGRCAICRTDQPGGPTPTSSFHVDHSHDDGRVRGLLCRACNTALGLLAEDPTRISALLDLHRARRPHQRRRRPLDTRTRRPGRGTGMSARCGICGSDDHDGYEAACATDREACTCGPGAWGTCDQCGAEAWVKHHCGFPCDDVTCEDGSICRGCLTGRPCPMHNGDDWDDAEPEPVQRVCERCGDDFPQRSQTDGLCDRCWAYNDQRVIL